MSRLRRISTSVLAIAAAGTMAAVLAPSAAAAPVDRNIIKIEGQQGTVLASGSYTESTDQLCVNLRVGASGSEAYAGIRTTSGLILAAVQDTTKNDAPVCVTHALTRGVNYRLGIEWYGPAGVPADPDSYGFTNNY